MRPFGNEKGLALIVAVAILLIFALMAVVMASLVSTDSELSLYHFRSGEALYITLAGQQYTLMQSYPPARVNPQISVGSGGFTVDPPAALSGAITNATNPIAVVCYDKGASVDCTTVFPATGQILIESELVGYTGVTATSFTGVSRGVGGSLAAAHAANQGVYHATALTAAVTNAATTIPVNSTNGFEIPGTIKIDQEFLYCTGTSGGFSGCTRGTQGTQGTQGSTAMAHNSGATAIQTAIQVTGTVATGIVGTAQRILQAQTGVYRDGWSVGNALAITANLNSVFCVTASDCWAVGDGGVLLHYNGSTWISVTSPTPQNLNDVYCLSATDCWAVGDLAGAGESCAQNTPNILRYNGTTWSCANTDGAGGGTDLNSNDRMNLNAVVAVSSTDVWVVGDFNNRAFQTCPANTPTIFRWDGSTSSWSCPNPGDNDDRMNLNSVYVAPGGDIWVVGDTTNRNNATCANNAPTVFRYSSGSWDCMNDNGASTDLNTNDRMNLNAVVAVSSTDVWVVGDFNNRAGQTCVVANTPTIFHWDGTNWSCPNTGDSDDRMNLNDIFAVSSTDIWVVGDTTNRNNATCANGAATIFHGTGGPITWSCGNTGATADVYNGVYCLSASNCWAVGDNGTIIQWGGASWTPFVSSPPLLRWNGFNWDTVAAPSGITQDLNAAWLLDTNTDGSADDGWAVGDRRGCANPGSTILRWNGSGWSCPGGLPVVDQNLNSVYMISSTDGWAVGNRLGGGTNQWTFLRWNSPVAGAWNQITVTTGVAAQNLNSVSMVSTTDGWAVGNRQGCANPGSTILRWDGSSWACPVGLPVVDQHLNWVSMVSTTDGWAVGNRLGGGTNQWTFLRWNSPVAGAWNPVTVTTGVAAQNLNSVSMVSTTDGWAVGNRRGCANPGLTILRYSAGTWACPAGLPVVDQDLESVHCNSSADCWATGNTGTMLHWDGAAWSQYSTVTTSRLNEVFLVRPQSFARWADWQEVY